VRRASCAWGVLIAAAALARAEGDVDVLMRRAEARAANGRLDGAEGLVEEVLARDPRHPRALALFCEVRRSSRAASLRYLRDARTLDPALAERLLDELQGLPLAVPQEVCAEVERRAMGSPGPARQVQGPLQESMPPQDVLSPLPAGPLRIETIGSPTDAHRAALREVASRFRRDRVVPARLWAKLALAHHVAGDDEASDAALGDATTVDPEDRVVVAGCALRAARDPRAWWIAHGPRLLADLSRSFDPCDDSMLVRIREVCNDARKVLVAARDMPGLLELTLLQEALWPVGYKDYVLSDSARAIARGWFADEAVHAIENDPDPVLACLQAHLLFEMLQDDLAIALLERTAREHPGCLAAWEGIWQFQLRAHLLAASETAAEEMLDRAAIETVPVNDWVAFERMRVTIAMRGPEAAVEPTRTLLAKGVSPELLAWVFEAWKGRPHRHDLAEDFAQAIDRTEEDPRIRFSARRAEVLGLLVESGKPEAALGSTERLDETGARAAGDRVRQMILDGEGFQAGKDLIRAVAAREKVSAAADALVRALCRGREPLGPIPHRLARVRQDLAADEAFVARPASGYLLSLLTDPVFEREEAARLRERSYNAGCRAPGLLRDLAREGRTDVLRELASIDAGEARLRVALAEEGTVALRVFCRLFDTATRSQRQEARGELGRRGVLEPEETGLAEPWCEADPEVREARLLLALVASSPARGTEDPATLTRFSPDEKVPRRDPWSGWDAYPALTLERSDRSLYVYAPVRSNGHGWDLGAARRDPGLIERLAEAHPTDLRWIALGWRDRPAPPGELATSRVFDRLAASRSRNAAFLLGCLSLAADARTAQEALARSIDLRAGDSTAALFDDIDEGFWGRRDMQEVAVGLVQSREAEAKAAWDLNAVSVAARRLGRREIADGLDEALLACDEGVLHEAALRRGGLPRAWTAAQAAAWADAPRRTEAAARGVRLRLLARAMASPEKAAAFSALEAIWNSTPIDLDRNRGTEWSHFDLADLVPGNSIREALRDRIGHGGAPSCEWYFSCASREGARSRAWAAAAAHLRANGLFDRRLWLQWLAVGPNRSKVCRDLVLSLGPGREALDARPLIVELLRELGANGGDDLAAELAQEWGRQCGDVALAEGLADWDRVLRRRYAFLPPLDRTPRVMPAPLLAPNVLCEAGFLGAAVFLFQKNMHCAVDPVIREACLLQRTAAQSDEAVVTGSVWTQLRPPIFLLYRLSREASTPEARAWAARALDAGACVVLAYFDAWVHGVAEESREAFPVPPAGVEEWEERLSSDEPALRDEASRALIARGLDALPLAAELARSDDPEVRERALQALRALLGPDSR